MPDLGMDFRGNADVVASDFLEPAQMPALKTPWQSMQFAPKVNGPYDHNARGFGLSRKSDMKIAFGKDIPILRPTTFFALDQGEDQWVTLTIVM